MTIILEYLVAIGPAYSRDGYDVEQETETVEYEVEYEAEDIIDCYGYAKTVETRALINYLLYEDLLKVEEDETFIEYLKDKYQEDFNDYMEGDGNPAELQIWDVM